MRYFIFLLLFYIVFLNIYILYLKNNIYKDGLTKIYNRKKFDIDNNKINKNKILVIIDIDNFKKINDTYGHINGDKVLIEISKIFRKYKTNNIRFYRYGGEEFVIIFKNYFDQDVYNIVDKIRIEIQNLKLNYLNNNNITISAGMSLCNYNCSDCLDNADEALYSAKNNGKNQIKIFNKKTM